MLPPIADRTAPAPGTILGAGVTAINSATGPAELFSDRLLAKLAKRRLSFDPASALWRRVLDTSCDPDRARLTLELLAARLEDLDPKLAKEAVALVWASGTTKGEPDTEGLLTPVQAYLALEKLASLGPADRAWADSVLGRTGSVAERALVLKTIGSQRARPVDDAFRQKVERVQIAVRDKDLDWLVVHTTGYGLERSEGIVQPGANDCQKTALDLARIESDPDLAIQATTDPSFIAALQAEERRALERRLSAEDRSRFPAGFDPDLDFRSYLSISYYAAAGLHDFSVQLLDRVDDQAQPLHLHQLDPKERLALLDKLEVEVQAGLDPIFRLTVPGRTQGHVGAIVDTRRQGGFRSWRVYDPEQHKTRWVPDQVLMDGPFDLASGARVALLLVTR